MSWLSNVKEELEKKSFPLMTAAYGALTVNDMISGHKEMQNKVKMTPLRQDENFKLQSPNAYQFEGGKHTDLKNTVYPNTLS